MKKLIAVSLTSAALIIGMSAPAHADHGETIFGAVIGTTVGTVIGKQVGGRNGAVIGAAIGAATGATIGNDVGHRRYQRVNYEGDYYPERVFHEDRVYRHAPPPVIYHPRPVESFVYVPVAHRYQSRPYPRDYDRCDHRGDKRRHHGHHRHGRRHWN